WKKPQARDAQEITHLSTHSRPPHIPRHLTVPRGASKIFARIHPKPRGFEPERPSHIIIFGVFVIGESQKIRIGALVLKPHLKACRLKCPHKSANGAIVLPLKLHTQSAFEQGIEDTAESKTLQAGTYCFLRIIKMAAAQNRTPSLICHENFNIR